jgi:hypothetical protein
MQSQALNRASNWGLIALSVVALVCVAAGYTRPPLPDEGALAHIFQLSVALFALAFLLFCATADWRQPSHRVKSLAVPITTMAVAFAALYYLEHVWYRQ